MSDYSPQRLNSFMTPNDFVLIHQLGFDHVRLPIDPTPLFNSLPGGGLNPSHLALLDNAVDEILNDQLSVVLVIFPGDDYKKALAENLPARQAFVQLWAAFAAHYAKSDPERIFFEIVNEPSVPDWPNLEAQAANAIRLVAPDHTIIASGGRFSGVSDLLHIRPLPLDNVIYTFHYYRPTEFVQQAADPKGGYMYPSPPAGSVVNEDQTAGNPAAENQRQPENENQKLEHEFAITEYDFEQWNRAHIAAEIAFARRWSDLYGVPVWCGEFGVDISGQNMSPDSSSAGSSSDRSSPERSWGAMRAAWLRDVRTALEQNGIGWAMWDYRTPNFGLVSYQQQIPVADPRALAALGLK